jgi:hypothetical protein
MHFYAPYPGISLFLVAVHLLRKGFPFVLAVGIKGLVFNNTYFRYTDTRMGGSDPAATL